MQFKKLCLASYLILAALGGCGGGDQDVPASNVNRKVQGGSLSVSEDDDLVLPNDRAQYVINSTETGYTITTIPDDGNSRSVKVLRRLQFADISLALDIEHSSQIYRLYQAAFDRKPDLAGLGYWLDILDKGTTLETISEGFIASSEVQKLYGSNPDNTQFITKLYNNILHRAPDQAGLDYWINAMQHGLSKAQALVQLSESLENKTAVAPAIEKGIAYAQTGINYRPVADAGKNVQVTTKLTTNLDATGSTDANSDVLSFSWSLIDKPATSNSLLFSSTTSKPYFIPDAEGSYTFSLVVKDKTSTSRLSTVMVTATAAPVPVIADTGIYKCSQLSAAQAKALYLAGHTYLDRDHDGKPCEANDIKIETPIVVTPPTAKQCWVNGYTRKNGTYVRGYWRSC